MLTLKTALFLCSNIPFKLHSVMYPEALDTGIPVWAPKLGVQIKGELMQNNITHLIISLMQMRQHVLRHLIEVNIQKC